MPGRGLGAEIDRDLKLPQNVEITTAHHQDKLWLHSFGLWRGPTTPGYWDISILTSWHLILFTRLIPSHEYDHNNNNLWSEVLLRRLYIIYQSFRWPLMINGGRHKDTEETGCLLLKCKGWHHISSRLWKWTRVWQVTGVQKAASCVRAAMNKPLFQTDDWASCDPLLSAGQSPPRPMRARYWAPLTNERRVFCSGSGVCMDGECPVTRERDSVNRVRKCKHWDEMRLRWHESSVKTPEPWTINELKGETKRTLQWLWQVAT